MAEQTWQFSLWVFRWSDDPLLTKPISYVEIILFLVEPREAE